MTYNEPKAMNKIDFIFAQLKELAKIREQRTYTLMDIFLHYRHKRVLTARDYKILKMRFSERKTLEEVAKYFGVSRERIRMIETKALDKIRELTKY